jgi:hypothetical protein
MRVTRPAGARPPSAFVVSPDGRALQILRCDVAALPHLDQTWARPDMFLPTALRPGYQGYYGTYSRIRLQDVRASLAEELRSIGQVLANMDELDHERDPRDRIAIENTILDYARSALMAAAAAETTLMQRRLARELAQ